MFVLLTGPQKSGLSRKSVTRCKARLGIGKITQCNFDTISPIFISNSSLEKNFYSI
jgi:hypothetical protein